jgi:hypothetical protein
VKEVTEIAKLIAELRQGTFTNSADSTRQLREDDFMIVAPYNDQVRRVRAGLPAGVRVGTLDKFQGQQAPIVFFSMTTSTAEDVPRNLASLFSRLNVAISRAQFLAYLICSLRLLEARCIQARRWSWSMSCAESPSVPHAIRFNSASKALVGDARSDARHQHQRWKKVVDVSYSVRSIGISSPPTR